MAGKREEQLKEITERLEQGVKVLFTSEKYTEYLKTMSQFHNYSFNNTLLIAMQKPESTLVAGLGTWNKKFNRRVKRGEKGIKIIAPAPIKEKEEIEKFDPETNEPVLRPDGQPETEQVEHIIPRFRVATVFDISQTYGDPLPELDTPELMGSVENFGIFMEAIGMVSPAPMRYAEIEGDAKGYYSNANKEIVIQEGMSEKQTMKTAVHEVTHAMCHDRDVMEELGEKKNQMTREVEAESVAFTVCSYFGLDTSDYSFPYIAGWSSDMNMKELRSSMDFIRKTAGSFIDGMVENMQKLQKEKAEQRELTEDDLVFQIAPLGEDAKKFYLVDNVGRVDFLRLLHTFAEQEKGNGNPEQFLKSHGVHLDLWRDSESLEKNQEMPEFYDVLYMDADHIVDAAAFSILIQVEMMISRAEYGHTALGKEAHNLAVQYAYKLDNPRDTKELVKKLAEATENPEAQNIQEIMEDAQAEIDFLPDNQIGLMQMHEYGYRNDLVLPLTMKRAVALHNAGLNIYSLNKDGSRTLMNTGADIRDQEGIFGIEDREWESYRVMEAVREENGEQEHQNEDLFFNSSQDSYAIYQIKDDSKGREYLFMGTEYLKKQGISAEYDDYQMVYSDVLAENETLDSLYEKFNIRRPLDFMGHSLSVSDVVALKKDGKISAHYVDSFGYTELPEFSQQKERMIEQGKESKGSGLQEPQSKDIEEKYQEVEIFGVPALFSNGRIPEKQVPTGLYHYDLQGSDDDPGEPITLEFHVAVNHAGTVLSVYPIPIPERGYLDLGEELNFTGGMVTTEQLKQSAIALNESLNTKEKKQELEERIQNAVIHSNEELLYTDTDDCYAFFQITKDIESRNSVLLGMDMIKKDGLEVDGADYSLIYGGRLKLTDDLESVCTRITFSLPEDFKGYYPTIGTVIVMNRKGEAKAYFLDEHGPIEMPGFIEQRKQLLETGVQQRMMEEKIYPPLYTHTLSYAMEHRRVDDYLDSRKLNLDCKKAIEDAIRKNFDGMHLAHDAAGEVLEEYGAERVVFILANTVQQLEYDGRFSFGNKAWAKGYEIPENVSHGMDMNADYVLSSHPAVLDGFIGLVREGVREQELGKEENVQINEETKGFIADGHFGTWHTAEMKEISGELFYRMEHEEYGDSVASIIVSQEGELVAEDLEHGFDTGAMEAIGEYFSEKGIEMEPEPSFIAQYYVMQNAEGGKAEREYQYFPDMDAAVTAYHQIPNHLDKRLGMESTEQPPSRMSLIECRNGMETLTDIEKYSLSGKWVRGETMKALQKAKEYLDNCDSEIAYQTGKGYFSIQTVSDGYDYTIYGKDFREIDGGVYDNSDITIGEAMEAILSDEGIQVTLCKVMNYEELQEKVEAAAQEDIQKARAEEKEKLSLISDRTEPEPALNGQSRAGIEETVLCYAQAQIDEMGLAEEVELLGARVYGSRSREGLYHEGSDIDVVVSYSGSLREDAFFNALHEDGLEIAGIPVDMNPISTEKTGTLEEYLENAEKYLDEKLSRMEIPENEQGGQTGLEATITFYVAECTEFPVLGEYHERLETLQEAMELYEKIPAERMSGIKGIGFRLEDGSIYDGNFDLMVMGEMQTEFINEIPQYRESPLVQKAISDMEEILSKQKERDVPEPDKKQELSQSSMSSENKEKAVQMYEEEKSDPTTYEAGRDTGTVETKAAKPEKSAENAPKADKGISGGSRKQSVLNALRERQARMKAQEKEKQGQEKTARKKGEQEL
ncbi:YodL domain-containing protein [Lachnospiraceae bacterium 48-21]